MKTPNTIKEVWEWRKRLAKEMEGLTPEEEIRRFNETGRKYAKKLGLQIYRPELKVAHHT